LGVDLFAFAFTLISVQKYNFFPYTQERAHFFNIWMLSFDNLTKF